MAARIVTYNICSWLKDDEEIGFEDRMGAVCDILNKCDLAALQEVSPAAGEFIKKRLGDVSALLMAEIDPEDLPITQGILVRKILPFNKNVGLFREKFQNDEGLMGANFNREFVFLNLHATSGSAESANMSDEKLAERYRMRDQNYLMAATLVRECGNVLPLVLCGDFNQDLDEPYATPAHHFECLKSGKTPPTETFKNSSRKLLKPSQMKDDRYDAIFYNKLLTAEGDFELVRTENVVFGTYPPSDHYGVLAKLKKTHSKEAMQLFKHILALLPVAFGIENSNVRGMVQVKPNGNLVAEDQNENWRPGDLPSDGSDVDSDCANPYHMKDDNGFCVKWKRAASWCEKGRPCPDEGAHWSTSECKCILDDGSQRPQPSIETPQDEAIANLNIRAQLN
eukprot:gene1162-464_t